MQVFEMDFGRAGATSDWLARLEQDELGHIDRAISTRTALT